MTASAVIADELVRFTLPDGRRGVAVLPVIPEDAPPRIREGIARRRIAATTGRCPCGAVIDYDAGRLDGASVAEVYHDRRCPADTARLAKHLRRWSQ